MTRIAFTADLHVDSYGSRIDPASGLNARLVDYLDTLAWLCRQAQVEEGCDGMVIAGDFCERRHPSPWLVGKIAQALGPAPEELVLMRGNHDGEIDGESIVTVLGRGLTQPEHAIVRPGIAWIRSTALCCIPFVDRHWLRAQPGFEHVPDAEVFGILAEQIYTIAAGLYAEASARGYVEGIALVLHQTLAGAHMSETQQAFLGDLGTVLDAGRLASIGFDGIVAGHLHRHQLLDGLACPVLYPGSIERVDFGEEHEAKGFVVADVERGRFDWRFVETPARRFATIDLETAPDKQELTEYRDAVVRVLNVPPHVDPAYVRDSLEAAGVFEITEIRKRPAETPESAGGMSEALAPAEALDAYFAGDSDAAALTAEGRRILEAVAA